MYRLTPTLCMKKEFHNNFAKETTPQEEVPTISPFADPSGIEPLTYDYLFKIHGMTVEDNLETTEIKKQ